MRNMDFWDNSEILSDNENEKTRKKSLELTKVTKY